MKDIPYLTHKAEVWGAFGEHKSDWTFIIVTVVLCALLYHI